MTTATRILLAFCATFLLFLGGCKKTVEGEEKNWTSNVSQIQTLAAQYPGFKPPLDARLAAAQGIYDAAGELDGDAQLQKMVEANRTLMAGFVADLRSLDRKIKELREKRVEAASKAGDDSSRLGAQLAAEDAQKALDRVEATLKEGATDEAAATAILKKVHADLDTARSAIDKVLKADAAKKSEAAAAEEAKAAAEAKAQEEAEAKVAPWKCEFCDGQNPQEETKCASCGAARP
jgi:septal ring factor EnvC (AmiA/AmiB activator)